MRKFLVLLKKEIKSLLTPQMLIPLVIMVVLFSVMGKLIGKEAAKVSEPKEVLVIDNDNSSLSTEVIELMKGVNLIPQVLNNVEVQEGLDEAKEKGIDTLIVIPEGFKENVEGYRKTHIGIYTVMRGFSISTLSSSASTKALISTISEDISKRYIKEKFKDVDPNIIQKPVEAKNFVIVKDRMVEAPPEMISAAVTSQNVFIPIILMFVIMMSAQMIASAVAMEKENKTLETLLTLPIKRTHIVISKMLGASLIALLMSVFYMYGMKNYIGQMTGVGGDMSVSSNILRELGLTFTPGSYTLLGISLFFAILSALSLATILAVYAEDVKSAQTLLTPLMVLLLIPYLLSFFTDFSSLSLIAKILLFLIPFSHPFLASRFLLFGNIDMVIFGIIYMALFSIVCIIIAAKIFSSDRVLTAKLKLRRGSLFKTRFRI